MGVGKRPTSIFVQVSPHMEVIADPGSESMVLSPPCLCFQTKIFSGTTPLEALPASKDECT